MVDYRVDPASVIVVGPEDAVREVREATTGSILVTSFTSPREVTTYPIAGFSGNERIRLKNPEQRVKVHIGIREESAKRILRNVPVRLRGGTVGARLKPDSIDVTLTGPASVVNSLERGNLLVEVDVDGLAPRGRAYRLEPRVSIVGVAEESASKIEIASRNGSIAVRIVPETPEEP